MCLIVGNCKWIMFIWCFVMVKGNRVDVSVFLIIYHYIILFLSFCPLLSFPSSVLLFSSFQSSFILIPCLFFPISQILIIILTPHVLSEWMVEVCILDMYGVRLDGYWLVCIPFSRCAFGCFCFVWLEL